jgi:tRNA nucleotidyltransferase/poly(A) polymerase
MELKEILKLIDALAQQYMIGKPYIVGGVPRDVYMKIPNLKTTDVDITTNSNDVLRLGILFADKINVTFELSDDGHVTVYSDNFDVDFSSHFVSEGVKEYLNGKYEGLEEVFSRDFTINTLHQDLTTGEIFDPTEMGFDDIKNKIIRTPVPPEITLTDDPRRIYRAINLAARYNFDIDSEIKNFVSENQDIFSPQNIKDKYI